MFASGQQKEGEMYDVDFDHQFMETENYDAKSTYKKFFGYRPRRGGYWRLDCWHREQRWQHKCSLPSRKTLETRKF